MEKAEPKEEKKSNVKRPSTAVTKKLPSVSKPGRAMAPVVTGKSLVTISFAEDPIDYSMENRLLIGGSTDA
jgi:hypothetical protein